MDVLNIDLDINDITYRARYTFGRELDGAVWVQVLEITMESTDGVQELIQPVDLRDNILDVLDLKAINRAEIMLEYH